MSPNKPASTEKSCWSEKGPVWCHSARSSKGNKLKTASPQLTEKHKAKFIHSCKKKMQKFKTGPTLLELRPWHNQRLRQVFTANQKTEMPLLGRRQDPHKLVKAGKPDCVPPHTCVCRSPITALQLRLTAVTVSLSKCRKDIKNNSLQDSSTDKIVYTRAANVSGRKMNGEKGKPLYKTTAEDIKAAHCQ